MSSSADICRIQRSGATQPHQKRRYALTAAILIASGVEPEDTSWWKANDVWSHAFAAAVVFVRTASQRRQLPIATICNALREPT